MIIYICNLLKKYFQHFLFKNNQKKFKLIKKQVKVYKWNYAEKKNNNRIKKKNKYGIKEIYWLIKINNFFYAAK